ncbi:MAG: translation initiation factor IF-2 [Armatimonadota bacterium]|nr:translation initiation factor IF-2 [Armatimonadota bacterium]MDR7466574.1 translation initiation factor IF-2 [Armatimonadota bacterium]MDR7495104.1 translation initiation factor IF-2 [Armatimonadota bacterium]MDR7500178.1 translation initiation factor IF-2 [Armatimonadota bacterium]MDR7505642.1 translation initiation factor IF-2 [Armatimonadota bacterium]
MRVHELAKELGLSSKALMDLLAGMKVQVKSHSSTLDEGTAERVRRQVRARSAPAPEPAPGPVRVAKTPTGERILGMRKIVLPSPPPAVESPAEAPGVPGGSAPAAGPAASVPAAPVAAAPAAPPTATVVPAPPTPAASAPVVEAPKPAPAEMVEKPRPPAVEAPQRAAPAGPPPPPPAVRPAARPPAPPARDQRPAARPGGPGLSGPTRPGARPMPPRREAPRAPMVRPPVPPPPPLAAVPGSVAPVAGAPAAPAPPAPVREFPKKKERFIPPPPPPQPVALPPKVPAEIELTGALSVGELAAKLELPAGEVVKKLLEQGVLAGINQQIPLETAARVAEAFGSRVRRASPAPAAAGPVPRRLEVARDEEAEPRAPVVTIMGHVDHGKTSLLDAIRHTDVAAREFGGITQHIGASTVELDGRRIVFIDTPGHEAFTALRARGAQVTDIAVLVVAADDGVMPQTLEAINHARAAKVPIIVAINKIDLPQANVDRVKQQLSDQGLVPEDWGGDTVMVPVSARTKAGLKELLEMILLVADLQELRANPNRPARGTIIEASLDKGRGPVATVLVQEGTLRAGDAVVAGEASGRVRWMVNDRGERLTAAGPSSAVEVVGLDSVPTAGDLLEVVRDDRLAKAVAQERRERRRALEMAVVRPAAAEEAAAGEGPKELRLIVKADTHGSVEALTASLSRLATPEVGIAILHAAVGNVTESDVMLAVASRAVIVGFNVRPEAQVRKLAEQEGTEILSYRVIYEALDDLRHRLRGLLAPKKREVSLGQAEVRQTFTISRVGTVAGCFVAQGVIPRSASVRLIRDGVVVYEGKIASLRRFKEDVREVGAGFECGIALERFNDVKVGDVLEAFEIREEPA